MKLLLYFFLFLYFIYSVNSTRYLDPNQFGYDNYCIFNPEGKLLGLEYIRTAINKVGGLITAIKSKDGIILLTSKPKHNSNLIVGSLSEKVLMLHDQLVMVTSGVAADSIILQLYATQLCDDYEKKFLSKIPMDLLCQRLSEIIFEKTLQINNKLFAVKVVLAGYDDVLGFQIYSIEPDGSYYSWKGVSIGGNENEAQNDLLNLMEENDENSQDFQRKTSEQNLALLLEKFTPKHYPVKSTIDQRPYEVSKSTFKMFPVCSLRFSPFLGPCSLQELEIEQFSLE